MKRISAEHLWVLRNDVPVRLVLAELRIPTKTRGRRVTFRCPACEGFHAAINPQANLVQCFRCRQHFNPIDLVVTELGCRFLDAVRLVESIARSEASPSLSQPHRGQEGGLTTARGGRSSLARPSLGEEWRAHNCPPQD